MVFSEDNREFIYRVDPEDRIVFANEHWYDFADENGASRLGSDAVVGRSLDEFLCDPETRHLMGVLIGKVRETARPVSFRFRCDAPDRRRYMRSDIVPHDGQMVELRSRILRQEFREPVHLLEQSVKRGSRLIRMCGWCKRVALPDDHWVEVEEAIRALKLFEDPLLPEITHGMCAECSASFMKEIG
jgi:hypothetical protein